VLRPGGSDFRRVFVVCSSSDQHAAPARAGGAPHSLPKSRCLAVRGMTRVVCNSITLCSYPRLEFWTGESRLPQLRFPATDLPPVGFALIDESRVPT
jgi:hypothetical protein